MRIALDARWIFREASGIGVYTRELIRNLAALDRENEYVLFFDSADIRDREVEAAGIRNAEGFRTEVLGFGVFSLANQVLMPGVLRRLGADVFHSTNYMIPLAAFPRDRRGRVACVVTIHDVIPLLFPGHAPRSRKTRLFPLYRRLMMEVGRRADVIIADSDASRRDVIAELGIPPARSGMVKTEYLGVSEQFRPGGIKPRFAGGERMVLYVGRQDPYKNCVRLIEAFAAARKRCGFPVRLLMAGPPDDRYPEAREAIGRLNLGGCVESRYLSDDELLAAYRAADVLVLPSQYEGFGFPVVEAMACGTPVICSGRGGLREAAGDAALFVEPDDTGGLASGIVRVLEDDGLAEELAKKGLSQAARFTWRRAAEAVLDIYRSFLSPEMRTHSGQESRP